MWIIGGGVISCSTSLFHETLTQLVRNPTDDPLGGRRIGTHCVKTIGPDAAVGISAAGDGQFFDQDD